MIQQHILTSKFSRTPCVVTLRIELSVCQLTDKFRPAVTHNIALYFMFIHKENALKVHQHNYIIKFF